MRACGGISLGGMQTRATATQKGYGWRWQKLSAAVLRRDNYICHYCGGHATTTDHIIPKAQGGSDAWDNLVASCRRCNGAKGTRNAPKPIEKPRERFSRRMLTNNDRSMRTLATRYEANGEARGPLRFFRESADDPPPGLRETNVDRSPAQENGEAKLERLGRLLSRSVNS
jgi:HNH endonuclease